MTRPTRFCRVAWLVDDMDATIHALKSHFGLALRYGSSDMGGFKPAIDEHGLEPIQLLVPPSDVAFMKGLNSLVEIALAVDDCEDSKRRLDADGIEPSYTSVLPRSGKQEYLYAYGFGGVPVMVCTDGDNEELIPGFHDLEAAPTPKVGVVTVAVDDIAEATARFGRYFGMEFVETDPAGLGARAVVGKHRVKLVERPAPALTKQFVPPLLAAEMMFDDADAVRRLLERSGFPVLAERRFHSGRGGWYFGSAILGLPLYIYHTADDAEARGLA